MGNGIKNYGLIIRFSFFKVHDKDLQVQFLSFSIKYIWTIFLKIIFTHLVNIL